MHPHGDRLFHTAQKTFKTHADIARDCNFTIIMQQGNIICATQNLYLKKTG